jgi:hypothetical protein
VNRFVRFIVTASLLYSGVCGAPAAAAPADPVPALKYLAGTWSCDFVSGAQHLTYTAHYAYAMGGNWMRLTDTFPGGGGDEALITYDPKAGKWITVVLEPDRTATIFESSDVGRSIAYHSVYPNAGMRETFRHVTDAKYTTNFTGTLEGKPMTTTDTCTKR